MINEYLIPDDLKGLYKDLNKAEQDGRFSIMLPIIGVRMLVERIATVTCDKDAYTERHAAKDTMRLEDEDTMETMQSKLNSTPKIEHPNLAAELYYHQLGTSSAEYKLSEVLNTLSVNWEDYSYDNYDGSLEIYGLKTEQMLTDKDKIEIKKMGFSQVWTHTCSIEQRKLSKEDGEQFYSLWNWEPPQ